MKKLITIAPLLTLLLLIGKWTNAQDYKTAVGLKFGGYESGVSVKYFTLKDVALEGMIGFRDHGLVFSGLFEIHQVAFDVPELKFYYGAGAHIGAIGSGTYHNHIYNDTHLLFGADGVLGLEYVIPKSPIAISVDLNPRAELATGPFFDIAPGLGLKYTF